MVDAPPESSVLGEGEETTGVSPKLPILKEMHARAGCYGLLGQLGGWRWGRVTCWLWPGLPSPLQAAGVVARVPVPSWQRGQGFPVPSLRLGLGLRGGRSAFPSSRREAPGKEQGTEQVGRGPGSPHPP